MLSTANRSRVNIRHINLWPGKVMWSTCKNFPFI